MRSRNVAVFIHNLLIYAVWCQSFTLAFLRLNVNPSFGNSQAKNSKQTNHCAAGKLLSVPQSVLLDDSFRESFCAVVGLKVAHPTIISRRLSFTPDT